MKSRQTCSNKKARVALGKVLRDLRGGDKGGKTRKPGITQGEVAKALRIAQPSVSCLEDGEYVFPLDRLFDLADAYRVPLISLVGRFGKKLGK